MMATNGADPDAQPLGLPGELREQIASNLDGIDLLHFSTACRTLRTELLPRLFTTLTLANSEKSAQSVSLIVSKYGDSVKDFTYVITYREYQGYWCNKCHSCEGRKGSPPDYWVRDFSQVYKILSTMYSSMKRLRSVRIKIVSKDEYACVGCVPTGFVILITG